MLPLTMTVYLCRERRLKDTSKADAARHSQVKEAIRRWLYLYPGVRLLDPRRVSRHRDLSPAIGVDQFQRSARSPRDSATMARRGLHCSASVTTVISGPRCLSRRSPSSGGETTDGMYCGMHVAGHNFMERQQRLGTKPEDLTTVGSAAPRLATRGVAGQPRGKTASDSMVYGGDGTSGLHALHHGLLMLRLPYRRRPWSRGTPSRCRRCGGTRTLR
ncbi:hypothetical protein MAPG_04806 [Magnaporthiopsis poae ATCC 64411]|uniref:Uncharacterized protein n=1 Tax=Magnaporthiopsis poae (strain ATCC 64411 / 73-15) TaxID=644358 RepID=A0A0C4DXQ2_MAGP6|nr:hypothetical protein MAPG_04806 [Magnaporthiopsis poae ATCC 64411]